MTVGITELPPEGMQLPGVALAGDAERGTKTTEGISLLFTTAGITVQGPQPQIERLLVWTALDSAACRESVDLPDGRAAVIMELTSGGQAIRFLLPSDAVSPGQAAYLDQALPTWLARYKGAVAPVVVATPAAAAPAPAAAAAAPAMAPAAAATEAERTLSPDHRVTLPAPRPTAPSAPAFAGAAAVAAVGVAAGAAAVGVAAGAAAGGIVDRSAPGAGGSTNGSASGLIESPFVPPVTVATPAAPAAPAATGPAVGPTPPATAWDEPPLGQPAVGAEEVTKTSRFSFARRKPKVVASATDVAMAPPVAPFPEPAPPAVQSPAPFGVQPVTAAAAAAAAAAVASAAAANPAPPLLAHSPAPSVQAPPAPPTPPAPVQAGPLTPDAYSSTSGPIPPGATTAPGEVQADGSSDNGLPPQVVLADKSKRSKRNAQVILVVVLVLVMLAGAGFLVAKGRSTTTSSSFPIPDTSKAADSFLAGSINLGLADLPTGWTQPSPAQVVVRPLVAPAVAHADATNAMAACMGTDYAVISGLFDSGSLPGETSRVDSPVFQSAAGSSFEMSSRTAMLASPGQVEAFNALFASPKFVPCLQQFQTTLAAAAVAGSSAQVQPVTLTGPAGVSSYGVVTTYTIPGAGTMVVGSAFLLDGRVVTVINPSTSGAPIDAAVFTAAFNSVAGRVAAASSK